MMNHIKGGKELCCVDHKLGGHTNDMCQVRYHSIKDCSFNLKSKCTQGEQYTPPSTPLKSQNNKNACLGDC